MRDPDDLKGLIAECYRIDGIGAGECRSVFLDWALSLPEARSPEEALRRLAQRHVTAAPDHPMSQVLREALAGGVRPERRGGRRARMEKPQ